MVGTGAFIGACLRYLISGCALKCFGDYLPYGTLAANILGCLFMGFLMEVSLNLSCISPDLRLFLTTGLLGGMTTFSTFSYETISMLAESNYLLGGLNAGFNLILSLLAVWLGKITAQMM